MTTPTPTSSPSARYNAAPGKGSAIVGKLITVGAVVFVVLAGIVIYQYYQKVTSATVSATTTGFSRIDDRTLTVSVDVTRDNVEIPSYCIITTTEKQRLGAENSSSSQVVTGRNVSPWTFPPGTWLLLAPCMDVPTTRRVT